MPYKFFMIIHNKNPIYLNGDSSAKLMPHYADYIYRHKKLETKKVQVLNFMEVRGISSRRAG